MVLDFLARLLGLGNVSEAIQGILKRIRKPIDDLIARIITFIKNKLRSFGGQKGKKGKKNTKEDDKREMKKDKGKDEVTDVDRKRHKQMAAEIKERLNKPLPRKPKTFEEFYKVKKKHAKHLEKTYQRKLKKGVKLSIQFEGLKAAEKRNKVKYVLEIRTNTLRESHMIGDDAFDQLITLTKWHKTINTDTQYNVLHFLKDRQIPMTLYSRMQEVKGSRTAQSGNGKLSIMEGGNRYSYSKHTVYFKSNIIQSLQKGSTDYFDAVTHEFDHAVRIATDQVKAFDQMKSEIFAFHAQMLTLMGEATRTSIGNLNTSYMLIAKKLGKYTTQYGYGTDKESKNLEAFFKEIYTENQVAKYKLAELIAFLDLLKQFHLGKITTFSMVDVQSSAVNYAQQSSSTLAYQDYIKL